VPVQGPKGPKKADRGHKKSENPKIGQNRLKKAGEGYKTFKTGLAEDVPDLVECQCLNMSDNLLTHGTF